MTKAREHLTFEHAVTKVAALIGYDGAAEACGKGERTVRWWSDPDSERCPCIEDALALDLAFLKAGGAEAPLFTVYMRRIEEAALLPAQLAAALAASSDAIRKSGEFGADAVMAAQPGAPHKLIARARAEAEDAASAFIEAARKLGSIEENVTPIGRRA